MLVFFSFLPLDADVFYSSILIIILNYCIASLSMSRIIFFVLGPLYMKEKMKEDVSAVVSQGGEGRRGENIVGEEDCKGGDQGEDPWQLYGNWYSRGRRRVGP